MESQEDPIALFLQWFEDAKKSDPDQPEAMTLATADKDGAPNARMVLLKGVDVDGFVFFTNTESVKGQELDANQKVALVFFWKKLGRQVRVRGIVQRVSDAEADAYFATRGRDSRVGAWASQQSRPLKDRGELEEAVAKIKEKYSSGDVPRPPHWTGFRVTPLQIEFWQAGDARLHERIQFQRTEKNEPWEKKLLYP